jgi:CelD/BcsL family acetyltransferase involved in cellulose biosynthesis
MKPFDPTDPASKLRWDGLVESSRGIDRWCSQTPWQYGVHHAFGTETQDLGGGMALHNGAGAAMFGRLLTSEGAHALVPFDQVWGFASPIVTEPNGESDFVPELADALCAEQTWKICVLTGFSEGSPLEQAIIEGFGRHVALYRGEERVRCVASLEGGVDHYLARRSREHRRNLRQATRRAEGAGLSFTVVDTDEPVDVIRRLHAIEARSWKGMDGSGIESPEMAALYESLIVELRGRGALRCVIAQHDGRDAGFILGGTLGDTYRGLQLSYVEEARALSVGNLLQWHEVQRMCTDGLSTYDLGMDIEYKRNWAENLNTTQSIIAVRR